MVDLRHVSRSVGFCFASTSVMCLGGIKEHIVLCSFYSPSCKEFLGDTWTGRPSRPSSAARPGSENPDFTATHGSAAGQEKDCLVLQSAEFRYCRASETLVGLSWY